MTASVAELSTTRLLLRPLELADHAEIQAIFPQWKIVRHLNALVPWPYPADGALTYVRDVALPAMVAGAAWHWSIRNKETPDRLIGVISLMLGAEENRGFWLDPPSLGKGSDPRSQRCGDRLLVRHIGPARSARSESYR